jgi:hypothetical protein
MRAWAPILLGLLALSAMPCRAKSDEPIFASPNFNAAQIDRIDVYVIDPNNDTAHNRECIWGAKMGHMDNGGAQASLAKRGYNKDGHRGVTHFYGTQLALTEAMLTNPSKDWLQQLDDAGRWVMIITIDELGSRGDPVKGLGRAALSLYLYDRDEGTLLWHDHAAKEHMWGGVLGNVMLKGEVKQVACGGLVKNMVMKLPKK